MNQKINKYLIYVFTFIAVVVTGILYSNNNEYVIPSILEDVVYTTKKIIDPTNLVDHKNIPVTQERLAGHWTFIFFGYTQCPDICPATIAQLGHLTKLIDKKLVNDNEVQHYFVSVDPERDSIKHLSDYIGYFGEPFTALTGNESVISKFEKQLGAYHRVDKSGPAENYEVIHSAEIFLVDPEGQLTAKFSPPMDIDLVFAQFSLLTQQFRDKLNKT